MITTCMSRLTRFAVPNDVPIIILFSSLVPKSVPESFYSRQDRGGERREEGGREKAREREDVVLNAQKVYSQSPPAGHYRTISHQVTPASQSSFIGGNICYLYCTERETKRGSAQKSLFVWCVDRQHARAAFYLYGRRLTEGSRNVRTSGSNLRNNPSSEIPVTGHLCVSLLSASILWWHLHDTFVLINAPGSTNKCAPRYKSKWESGEGGGCFLWWIYEIYFCEAYRKSRRDSDEI